MKVEKGRKELRRAPVHARSFIALSVFTLVAVLIGFVWYCAYVLQSYGSFIRSVTRIVPLPAAFVMDETVWLRDVTHLAWFAQQSGLENAYDEALEAVIRRAYASTLAAEAGVEVDAARVLQILEGEDEQTWESLGWSRSEYARYIVEPLVLQQQLEEVLYGAAYQAQAYEQTQRLQAQYADIGIAFGDLAYQFSQGASAYDNGWIGFYTQEDLPKGYEAVWEIDVDETMIVELDREFVLLRVYDEIVFDTERTKIALQEIVVKKDGYGEVLDAYIATHPVIVQLVR